MPIFPVRRKWRDTSIRPCLMVGIKGQTKEMIARDIEYLKRYFKLGTVNVYNKQYYSDQTG